MDLSEFVLKNGENKIAVNIESVPNTVKIKNSNGLAITVNTEAYATKEVPVKSLIIVFTALLSSPSATTFVTLFTKDSAPDTTIVIPVDEDDNEIKGVQLSQKWAEATIQINQGKTVPIKINTTGILGKGLKLKSISSTITEIGITGSEAVLNSINEIETETINLSEITDSTNIPVVFILIGTVLP